MAVSWTAHEHLQQQLNLAINSFAEQGLLVLSGPSGSGKTWLGGRLHDDARLAEGNLVLVECASLAENRFESQLFGHEKGAFSGAGERFEGLVGAARGGILLLEGIEALSLGAQARLLRFIGERTYRPVGGHLEKHYSGRLIFTCSDSLTALYRQKRLREDFYYRIAANEFQLPPLSQRPRDLPALIAAILKDLAAILPSDCRLPTQQELADLAGKPPAGNLHGIRNLLQQAMLRGVPIADVTGPAEPRSGQALPDSGSLKGDLHQLEKMLLQRALQDAEGRDLTREELAAALGISRRALMYKLREHGLNQA